MIAVAGAGGMIGRALAEVLASGRRPRTEIHRAPPAAEDGDGVTHVACDVTDEAALARSVPVAGAVIHLAGVAPGRAPRRPDHEVAAMRALCALARARRCERFVFLSATGASERSPHPWLREKARAEALLRECGVPFVILRAGLVHSAESPAMNALMQVVRVRMKLRLPLLRGGRVAPLAAGDAAIALATALDHHRVVGRTIDVGAAPAITLDDLLRRVARRLGEPLRIARLPFTGVPLARALQSVPVAPLTDAAGWIRTFALAEPPDLSDYDRMLPMNRAALDDELRGYPWGPPPLRPGDPLPTFRDEPAGGVPLIVPGDASVRGRPGPAWLGRTDPFGRIEREDPGGEPVDKDP